MLRCKKMKKDLTSWNPLLTLAGKRYYDGCRMRQRRHAARVRQSTATKEITIMQKNLKKLTILHSNDLHGDFLAEQVDKKLVGGLSSLSGYVNKVRSE